MQQHLWAANTHVKEWKNGTHMLCMEIALDSAAHCLSDKKAKVACNQIWVSGASKETFPCPRVKISSSVLPLFSLSVFLMQFISNKLPLSRHFKSFVLIIYKSTKPKVRSARLSWILQIFETQTTLSFIWFHHKILLFIMLFF